MLRVKSMRFVLLTGLIAAVFVAMGGFFAVQAQFYIKKSTTSKENSTSGKPKVFITPKGFENKNKKKAQKAKLGKAVKLKLAQDKDFNNKQIKLYEDWLNSGKKPETVQEMAIFAQAKSAVNYGAVLEYRSGVIPRLARIYSKLELPVKGELSDKKNYKKYAALMNKNMGESGFDYKMPKTINAFYSETDGLKTMPANKYYSKFETPSVKAGKGESKTVTVKQKKIFNSN